MTNRFSEVSVLLCSALLTAAVYAAPLSNSDDQSIKARVDSTSALVQLNGDPLAINVRTKPAHGKKIDFDSSTVKSERALLSNALTAFNSVVLDPVSVSFGSVPAVPDKRAR